MEQESRYRTLYADPPWLERGSGKIVRGAQRHYPLMHTREIIALQAWGMPVWQLAAPNAHLYLWTTNNFLLDALEMMRAWGFAYKTCVTWAKNRIGLGQYFRGQTEHCLFGVRGNLPYRMRSDGGRAQGTTLISAPRGEHSRKPEEMRRMIESVSPGPYLELFARGDRPSGWDVWGNEAQPARLHVAENTGALESRE